MIFRLPNPNFWKGKKVLITGHTGFKGSWLTIWLNRMGASVSGISLEPESNPNLFTSANISTICDSSFIDIKDLKNIESKIKSINPEIIIHMAAQPLVRQSYLEPRNTFLVNAIGTANILESIRFSDSVKVALMITTDKVYKNDENGRAYEEDDPLGGHDPYSASKAAAEIIIASYNLSFLQGEVSISSARAGNVIGGGDWSRDRLIPDAIKAWQENIDLDIRNPSAIRPWQHVLEPLSGYLMLIEDTFNNNELCGAYNFGPNDSENSSVKSVIEILQDILMMPKVNFIDNHDGLHEANFLSLDITKAVLKLNFKPKWNLKESVKITANWYKSYYDGKSPLSLCEDDINSYEDITLERNQVSAE